jgi:hypothetical protein
MSDVIEVLTDAEIEAAVQPTQLAVGKSPAGVPEKVDLLPGIVRHGMLCEKVVRDQFAIQAKLYQVNQGDLLAACIQELKRDDVKLRIGAFLAARGCKPMTVSEKGKFRAALDKVDPKALEAFLKAQGISL